VNRDDLYTHMSVRVWRADSIEVIRLIRIILICVICVICG